MRKQIYKAIKNPLMSGSILLFIGFLSGNFFNFLFNVYMSRTLSVADYGTLASLVSIILLFALAAEALTPTVVSFAGSYFAKKEIGKVVALFWKLNAFFVIFSLIVLGFLVVFAESIGHFFKISNTSLLFIVGVIVFFTSVITLNRGILMGRLSFRYISFLNIFPSMLRLLSGISLVMWGLGVTGGLVAFLVAYASYYLLSFIPLKFIFQIKTKETVVSLGKILAYAAPSAMAMLGLTLFITTDMLLVKHFYSSKEAGIYAGMSLLGKIIYFFSAPISTVLFPLVVQRHARNEKHNHLFFIAMSLVAVSSLSITFFYYIFPEFSILLLLKQKDYLSVAPIIWVFGIFMVTYSLLWLTTNYYLSMKKTKIFIPILIGAVFQAIALWFYHDTFLTVIFISIISTAFPLCIMLVDHWKLYNARNGK